MAPPVKVISERTGYEYEAQLTGGKPQVLGKGTFGTVVRASDITNKKSVAIKKIDGDGEREIELMSAIPDHENIVKCWTSGVKPLLSVIIFIW